MEEKLKQSFKPLLGFIAGIVMTATIGFAIGYLLSHWFPEMSGGALFFIFPVLILFTLFGYLIQIIVHEAGHLIFGLLSGYQFSSFRVGSAVLLKREGKFKTGKYTIPGTGGQCLMGPPAYHDGNFPFVLYNLGGVLLNLMTTGVAVFFLSAGFTLWLNLALIGFILGGLLAAATNGIPMTIGGIPNDAQNIRVLKEDKALRDAFWFQLQANHLLTEGERPKDLAVDDLEGLAETDLDQPLNAAIHLLRYNHYLDKQDFVQAKETLNDFAPYEAELMPLYLNELKFERLFLELIGENREEIIHSLYTDELLKHAERVKGWPNHQRTLMAYEWFHKQHRENALAYYEKLQKAALTHPTLGEVKMELSIAEWIKQNMDKTAADE